ncbi:phosphatase domain-containing protein [Marinoscillum luteum]|uniref:Phosphatase domain-containing protein n=1 Tax=Marinoscillum luteum TaxID=861051 RepID=A0ABW7N7T4_9BACT
MRNSVPFLKVYQSFASDHLTMVMGHVLKSPSHQRDRPTRNPFKNALEMYRRYHVKPSAGEKVFLTLAGKAMEVTTDGKGFFQFKLSTPRDVDTLEVTVALADFPTEYEHLKLEVHRPAEVIVSDIDDTILVSHSTSLIRKLYLLLTKNHQSRQAFDGVKDFYDSLKEGRTEPLFFYVSSSEWNLYDFLESFVADKQLPAGVFLLQDIKSGILDLFRSGGGSHSHKKSKIETLIKVYPEAKFTLIGDSGQKDPDIYQAVALTYPEHIAKIYIRDVRKSRRSKVKQMASALKNSGVDMVFFSE